MKNSYIVRADHYPDGCIIPLGVTDSSGKTMYIDRVIDINTDNSKRIKYLCKTKEKMFVLTYVNSKWAIEE